MSAPFNGIDHVDAAVARDRGHVSVGFDDRLVVGRAAAVRRFIADELDALPSDGRAIVDLSAVTELDAAGLAAVTSPVFATRRRGCRVTVLPPTSGSARRFAQTVGILPIGVG